MLIGSHVSISGGLLGAAKEAYSYGCLLYTSCIIKLFFDS